MFFFIFSIVEISYENSDLKLILLEISLVPRFPLSSPCNENWLKVPGNKEILFVLQKRNKQNKTRKQKTTKRQQQKKSLISLVRHLGSIKLHLEAGISYTECLKAWMKDLLGMKRLSVTDFSLENNLPTFD